MNARVKLNDHEVLKYVFEQSHLNFTRYFFRQREGIRLICNPHHNLICEALSEVINGNIKRLIINVPPGYTKTELAVIFFIARGLAINPKSKFMHLSYSDDLALLNSQMTRDIVESEEFQEYWPMEIRTDVSAKKRWFTKNGGGVYATSSGGPVTGFRAGRMESGFTGAFIIDDPIKPEDAFSEAARTRINRRFNSTFKSRLAKESETPIILIMQRVHEDDPSGFLLKGGTGEMWHHLLLPTPVPPGPVKDWYPAEYTHGIPIEYTLPEGPLWEYKHNAEELERMYTVDPYTASSQYGNVPAPLGGGLFKEKWWRYYDVLPLDIAAIRIYGDTASKTAERNDYSVFQCWGWSPSQGIFLIDQVRGKWEAPELRRTAIEFWNKHRVQIGRNPNFVPVQVMKVEDKSSGIGLIQDIRRETNIPIEGIARNKDKVERSFSTIPHIAAGHVHLPMHAPWLSDYKSEFSKFTPLMTHAHDDQIDPTMDAIEDLLIFDQLGITAESLK
jgi:predicted phage terminase large subunit-like protein